MTVSFAIQLGICILFLVVTGWLVFSLAAGIVVYLTSSTTNHVSLEAKKIAEAEGKSVMMSHTKDPLIMSPLNAAKERWQKNRENCVFKELLLESKDGLLLAGYMWEGKIVILVHGMMDSAAGMGYLAEEYHQRGWAVLSIDHRSHGESEGTKRTMCFREGEDLSLWIHLLINTYDATDIYLRGVSMGGATFLLYGGRTKPLPSPVKGIIADSSYARYDETFSRVLSLVIKNIIISRSITLGASIAIAVLCGVRFSLMSPIKYIAQISVPVLLFHGQKDVLVPISQARKILAVAMKLAHEIVVIPDAPHIGAYFYAPELYMQKIDVFCRRNK